MLKKVKNVLPWEDVENKILKMSFTRGTCGKYLESLTKEDRVIFLNNLLCILKKYNTLESIVMPFLVFSGLNLLAYVIRGYYLETLSVVIPVSLFASILKTRKAITDTITRKIEEQD